MIKQRLKTRRLRIWSPDYLHYVYLWTNLKRMVARALNSTTVKSPIVLDVGCGNRPYEDWFSGCTYFGLNYGTNDATPHLVGDALSLPIASNSVDIVFCSQVIEHVPDPKKAASECHRVLKPGGQLVMSGPFFWPLHEEPHDYHRFTKYGFQTLLVTAGFTSVEVVADGGDMARFFLSMSLSLRGYRMLAPVRMLLNILGQILDRVSHQESYPANYTIFGVASK